MCLWMKWIETGETTVFWSTYLVFAANVFATDEIGNMPAFSSIYCTWICGREYWDVSFFFVHEVFVSLFFVFVRRLPFSFSLLAFSISLFRWQCLFRFLRFLHFSQLQCCFFFSSSCSSPSFAITWIENSVK